MKFIKPSVEYWSQKQGIEGIWHQIARATKVSYQSQGRVGESDEDFVKRVILKPALIKGNLNNLDDCEFDFDKLHGSCLEQCAVYLVLYWERRATQILINCKGTKYYRPLSSLSNITYITTNVRTLLENGLIHLLREIVHPSDKHPRRYTFSMVTDIGVTREANRHRVNSIVEESSRYCAYDKGKFNSQITYILPAWISENSTIWNAYGENNSPSDIIQECKAVIDGNKDWTADDYYIFALKVAEYAYLNMRKFNIPAEKCRQVLNLNTKTQIVHTAFKSDWEHFIRLRAQNKSGKVHPNMLIIAQEIEKILSSIK